MTKIADYDTAERLKVLIGGDEISGKTDILKYLSRRDFVESASSGRITDALNSNIVEEYCFIKYSDGEYKWRSHDIYYLDKYNLKLNEDFVVYVLDKINPK